MFHYGTCDKLAALQVVGVTDVVIAEASDTIVVEGLDVSADVCVELEAAIWSFQHLLIIIKYRNSRTQPLILT